MAKQAMLFDSTQHGFESVGWRLQIKSLYSPQNLLVCELKFPVKRYNFLQLQNFVYAPPLAATQGKCCLLMRQKS